MFAYKFISFESVLVSYLVRTIPKHKLIYINTLIDLGR